MESFDPVNDTENWSYNGVRYDLSHYDAECLRVMINGVWYPRFTTEAIIRAFKGGERWSLEQYHAQLIHYGFEDTLDYETAKARLRSEM